MKKLIESFLKSSFYLQNRTFILMVLDGILVNLAIILTFLIRFGGFPKENFIAYQKMFIFILLIRLATFYYFGLYRRQYLFLSKFELFYDVFVSVTVGSILILAMTFINRSFSFPRTVSLISWFINIIFIFNFRNYLFNLESSFSRLEKVLIVGDPEIVFPIVKALEKSEKHQFLGYFVCDNYWKREDKSDLLDKWLGRREELNSYLENNKIDTLILADSEFTKKDVLELLFKCEKKGINLKLLPSLYELLIGKATLVSFLSYPLIETVRIDEISRMNYIKRIFDFIISFLLLIALFPIFVIIAILIKLDSPGPVFFLQRRVGLNGSEFLIFKFRSMVEDAESKTGPVMASEEDPRITKVGRILRKYRLDELPQFINVLLGEMSLVGPRPERVEFVEDFSKRIVGYHRRFLVRPGITGLAQVRSSYALDPENKLRYDLAYINNWSFFLDLEIIIETLKVVLFKKGAV